MAVMRHEISAPRGGHERSSAARGIMDGTDRLAAFWSGRGRRQRSPGNLDLSVCEREVSRPGLDQRACRGRSKDWHNKTPQNQDAHDRRRRARHSRRVDCILNAATDVGNGEVE